MHSQAIFSITVAMALGANAQTLQCNTVAGGCDQGTAHRNALAGAVARFDTAKFYGGTENIFATYLDGTALAQIAYTCSNGNQSPVISGADVRSALGQISSCPNLCGSVSLSESGGSSCGIGVLIVDGATDEACFSKAINAIPSSTEAPQTSTKTQTATSASATITASPTVVPSIGNFVSRGCLADSTTAPVLVADSKVADDMSVQECVDFAFQGAWQYAGLKNGRTCLVGSTLHNTSSAAVEQSQCASPCTGDASQACGSGANIQLYQDTTFRDATADELAIAVQHYNSTLLEAYRAINDFKAKLQAWQDNVNSNSQGKRLAARGLTQTQVLLLEGARDSASSVSTASANLRQARPPILRLFLNGKRRDVIREGQPPVDETEMTTITTSTTQAEDAVSNVEVRADADRQSIAASLADSTTPLLPVSEDSEVIEASGTAIGIPGVVKVGGAVATGLFLALGLLYLRFHPDTGGGDHTIPPTSVITSMQPTSTSTSTSSTTTSTCQPTGTPRSIVVLMKEDSAKAVYEDIVANLKTDSVEITDQIIYDEVNIRAFTALLDDCQAEKLWKNSSVSTVSLNIGGTQDAASEAALSPSKREFRIRQETDAEHDNFTANNLERSVDSPLWIAQDLGDEAGPPFHLGWLTATWAQRTLPGTYLAYNDYLFNPNEKQSAPNNVRVYVLDTGVRGSHSDLGSNIGVSFDATQRDLRATALTDVDGHGTCMASCVGGSYSGVFKGVSIVPIKIANRGTDEPPVNDLVNAVSLVLFDMQSNPTRGFGVMSMSIGYPLANIRVNPGQTPGTIDPFDDLLDRIYNKNVVAVASTGNDASQQLTNATPRLNGGRNTALIVVGATARDSSKWQHTTYLDSGSAGIMSIYANGVNVLCAGHLADDSYKLNSGSSPATAMVAGLVAMHLARGDTTPAGAKAYILGRARQLKGNWAPDPAGANQPPNGVPRAALGNQVPCTPTDPNNVPVAVVPPLALPTDQFVNGAPHSAAISLLPEPACVTPA